MAYILIKRTAIMLSPWSRALVFFLMLSALMIESVSVGYAAPKPKAAAKEQFTTFYGDATDPNYAAVREKLKKARVLEETAKYLNGVFIIPRSITLSFDECDTANAFYDSEERKIVFCYELLEELSQQFQGDKDYENLFNGTYTFVLLHELGHALIDVLNLPVTGREEDAADQLATWMLIDGPEKDQDALRSSVVWFGLTAQWSRINKLEFADEHSLNVQRFF